MSDPAPSSAPPVGGPAPPERRGGVANRWWDIPLQRRADGTIGGVVGGIADTFGFDAGTARAVTVVAGIVSGGTVVMLYLLAWMVLPEAPQPGVSAHDLVRGRHRPWVMVIAALILFGSLSDNLGQGAFGNVFLAAVLLLAGGLLWRRADSRSSVTLPSPNQPHGRDQEPQPEPALWLPGAEPWNQVDYQPPVVARPLAPVVAARRRGLWRGVFAAATVLVGLAIAADMIGFYRLDGARLFGWLLVAVGGGLAASAFLGGGRLLAVLAALLLGATVAASQIDNVNWDIEGATQFVPTSRSEAEAGISQNAGALVVDLSAIVAPGEGEAPIVIPVRVGAGQVIVRAPASLDVEVEAQLGIGEIETPTFSDGGAGVHNGWRSLGAGTSNPPKVRVMVSVGAGRIAVEELALR